VDRSHGDYSTHRLPLQHERHRRYGNVPAAVGWYQWHAGGVDVTDDVADHRQMKSSESDLITARQAYST